ncbi:hypothetical protein ScPMuIL_017772 [Solemya velum]
MTGRMKENVLHHSSLKKGSVVLLKPSIASVISDVDLMKTKFEEIEKMEMSRSSAPAAMETTNNVPKPPPPPPPLLPNEKPPPLPLPPSSQQVSVLFREKERQRPRYQSIAFNKGGRDFAAVKQKVAEEGPKISKADLLVGLKNLKRTNRRFIPVSLDREEVFASHGINDYLPLAPVKELLMTQALTSDVVSLNLSGLEQLTDVFFHVLKFFNIRFGSLTKLNCSGCHHLTDTGIRWASEVFTGLQEVEFKGCKNLTERSLYYLLTSEQSFISISMMGTSVGVVPGEYSNTSSSLNLLGCPLVSPPLTIHKEKPRQGFAEYKKDLAPLNTYKAIIVQDSNIPSLGERIVNGTTTPVPSVLSVWLNHQFDRTSAISYNIFQVPDTFSVTDMFLSESSIIFFPYTQSAESAFSNQLIQELATKITAVLSRSPESVYILVGLLDSGDEKSDFTEDVRKSVLEKLAKWKDELEGPIAQTKGSVRAWRMAEMHFHEQQVWACGESLFQQLGELSQDQASRLLSISLPVKLSPAEERDLFSAMFSKALMTLTQMFSSNYHPSFFPHLHTAIAAIEKQELTLTTSKSIMEKSNIYDAMLNCRETFACTGKILEIMNRVGKCLYFPFVDEKPAVLNLKSWVVFLDKLFNSEAPHRASFRCIGLEVPCWTLSDIRELAGIHSGESLKLHLDVLYKHGCLLKLPRDPWCNVSEESFLFVLVKDLPTQPAVEIVRYWQIPLTEDSKPKTAFATHFGLYEFEKMPFGICGAPGLFQELMTTVFRDCREFCMFYLDDICVFSKDLESHMKHVQKVFDKLRESELMLKLKKCSFLKKETEYLGFQISERGILPSPRKIRAIEKLSLPTTVRQCRAFIGLCGFYRRKIDEVSDESKRSVQVDVYYDELIKRSNVNLVPRHDEEFQKIHNLIRADTYTRCFQCQNCAAEGMDCERNIRNGQTKQHCRCRLYVMVCTFCGVCRRCAKFLAKLNAVLFPCFELPVTPSGGEVSVVGDMVNLKQLGAEIQITQPMTADYFPCLCIMFLRGSMLSLSLDIGGKTLSYNTGEGTISFAGKTTEGTELRCKDGDNFSLHLIHPGADLGEKVFQMKLNGFVIFSLPTLSDECKIVSIKALHPSGILLYGPGFMRLPNNALLGEDGTVKKMCMQLTPAGMMIMMYLSFIAYRHKNWPCSASKLSMKKCYFEKFLEKRGISRWLMNMWDRAELFRNFDEDANGTLDSREIGKLNAAIFSIFPRFGYKGSEPPDEDTPDSFPEELLDLPCLDYLSLQYQAIVRVPPAMERLSNLRSINLSNNPHLLSIPAEAGNLPLTRLELEECALLKTPPKEIREKGFATTYAYLRRLLTGSVECKRTKLMLVGLGGAGKTSLVRSLLSGNHKSALPTDEEITDGIDISTWSVKYQDEHLTYSVWDFAGQTVYYNTHQFFLSNRAVYLLLWNVRLGHEHAGLDFWLSSVCVHAPKAPIFVVGTHYDQVSKIELPVKEMKQRYPQICGFHFVSSLTGQGVQQLQDHLLDITKQQQYMGEQIPGVWLTFENHIVKYRETADVVEYSDVEKKANISGIFDKTEIYQAVQFLHDLGSLQHFTNNFLKSKVVINPQWIVDVMACVVSVKDSHVQEGRLLHSDIGKVWANYPKKLHSWLLRLTEEFDLTFPLHNEEVNLVPCLLPELQPDFDWPELDRNSSLKEAKMIYQFDYLPAGLFNRGQVRLHQFSEGSLIWKRGSFLKKNTHIALIRQIRDCELVVVVQGPRPENILFLIHEVFEGLIVESFQGVTYDLLIPCPDCIKQVLKDPHMFSASTIRRAVELKAPFLQCLKYFHTISMVDLLAVMPPDSHSDYDIHLIQAVRGLKDLRKDMTTDIFISYSCGDIPDGNKKMLHPVTIWTDLETAGYKCWFAEQTKNYTTDEMAVALIDSSVFVALISSHYVKDESCCDLFKYARLTLKKPIIIVVVGEGMDWKQSKLGLLLADEVFVNMTNAKLSSYKSKLDELLKFVKDKIQRDVSPAVRYPKCFISYCWINSATAVSLGTRHVPAALGPGDPRQIKEYLEQRGIECWIDVERVGMNGLFEDIAEGLLNAKMLIACVSDEYASSPTCQLEFRYAANTLKLPIILAVVGTGNNWRATEVGILSLGYPLISFQEKSETALEKLFLASKSKLQSFKGDDEEEKKKTASNEQLKNLSFQELFELAQRKFLRQIINYADAQDMEPYPRLFLVDFVKEESKPEDEEDADSTDGKNQGQIKLLNMKRMSELFKGFKSKLFCTYILCEHEEGWHSCDNAILLPRDTWNVYLEKFAPYLARIMAIMKYSKHQLLSCMGEEEGQQYIKWLEECPQANVSDFQQIYHELRREIVELDSRKTKGQLARCHLPNGKTIWLCEKHRSQMRVTVLSGEVASTTHKERENPTVTTMIQELRLPSNQLLAAKFKSCRKSRRNPSDKKKKFGNVVQRDNQVGETQSSRTGLESTSPSKKRKAAQPTQRPSQITLLNSSVASLHRLGTANENSDEVDSSVRTQTPPANQESRDKKVAPRSSISDGVDSSKSKQNIGETESKEMGDARQDEKGIGGIQTPSANQGLKKNAEPSSPKLGTIDSHIDSHRDNESKERETAAAKQVAMAMGQNIERRQTIPGMEASTTSKSSKLIRQKSKACAVM